MAPVETDGEIDAGDSQNKTLKDMSAGEIYEKGLDMGKSVLSYLPTLLIALFVLAVGWCLIGCCTNALRRRLENMRVISIRGRKEEEEEEEEEGEDDDDDGDSKAGLTSGRLGQKKKLDPTLVRFGTSCLSNGLKLLLIFTVASMLGIQTTSFIAVFTACSLAIGLALQGLLTDLAKGVLLMIFRPYKVGDIVMIEELCGEVSEVQIFQSILKSPDNKTYIIPNGSVGIIQNLTGEGKIRLDITFKISHDQDYGTVEGLLLNLMHQDKRVHKHPEPPAVLLLDVQPEGVEVIARAWVNAELFHDFPPSFRRAAYLEMTRAQILLARHWEVDPPRAGSRYRSPMPPPHPQG